MTTQRFLDLIAKSQLIFVVSGEGEEREGGAYSEEIYTGKRSIKALKTRLTKERSNGDRWAYVKIYDRTITDCFGDKVAVFYTTTNFEDFNSTIIN